MPIDPNIIGGLRPPQFANPLEQASQAMSLAAARQQMALGPLRQQAMEQQIQSGKLEAEKARRDLDEETAFKAAVARNATPFELLGVAPRLAGPHLKAITDQTKSQLDNLKTKTAMFSQALGSVKYAPAEQQAAQYGKVRAEAIQNGLVKPEEVPEQFDPAFVDQHFRAAINADKQIDDHQKELEAQQRMAEAAPKTAKGWRDLILQEASTAGSQAELDQTRQRLQGFGVPKDLIAQTVPAMWSESAMKDLASRGMTPEQRAQAAIQKQNADTATKNAENNVGEYELELRAAKGDPMAKKALTASTERKRQVAVASGAATRGLDREIGQFGKPFQTMATGADSQLDKILDAEKMIAGGAVEQALGVPKILTALVSGQGSGVRITQAELNSIAKARGIGGDIEGFINKMSGKGSLTDTQKRQMQSILQDVRERIVQKKVLANSVLDEMNSARSREDILAAEKKGRAALGAERESTTQPHGIPELGSTFNGGKVLKVTKVQ